jgi:hypothetical protein
MSQPRSPALDREEAMKLLSELQDLQGRLRRMRDGLLAILREAEAGK